MRGLFAGWIFRVAYPDFECARCIGQSYGESCYCAAHGAVAPATAPRWWHLAARWLLRRV